MSLHHGYKNAFAITPSNTVNFAQPCEVIYVGGVGGVAPAADVVIVMSDGSVVTFPDVPIGTFLPVKAKRVNATGTGVGLELVGLWGQ